jgi:hypothetical protein
MLACYLANGLGRLKPKIGNPGDNTFRRLRLNLGCNTIAAAANALKFHFPVSYL